MTQEPATPPPAPKRSWVIPAVTAVAVLALAGGGFAVWNANQPDAPVTAATSSPTPTGPINPKATDACNRARQLLGVPRDSPYDEMDAIVRLAEESANVDLLTNAKLAKDFFDLAKADGALSGSAAANTAWTALGNLVDRCDTTGF